MQVLKLGGEYDGLRFLATIEAVRAFIQLWISMTAAKMPGALGAHHKTHPNSISGLTHITVLFSFGFRHIAHFSIRNR